MAEQSMVERVAKAILADKHPDLPWEIASELCRNDFLGHARAAIEALREPTEAMREAVSDPAHQMFSHGHIIDVWNHMIDAALKED
jgi:hypothetical protein